MANITLVLLPKNDDGEMREMRQAIAATLQSHQHVVSTVDEPAVKDVRANQAEVWLCGHSRFEEADTSNRKFAKRNLGGYPLPDIAEFLNGCVLFRKIPTVRLICCESAQHKQGTRKPQAGGPPQAHLAQDLGTIEVPQLTANTFNSWLDRTATHVSHLEQLLVYMKMDCDSQRKKEVFPAFEIVGLWGAGNVEPGKRITAFLQPSGGLQAEEAARKSPDDKKKQDRFATFQCSRYNLPDFFGYQVAQNFFRNHAVGPINGTPFQD